MNIGYFLQWSFSTLFTCLIFSWVFFLAVRSSRLSTGIPLARLGTTGRNRISNRSILTIDLRKNGDFGNLSPSFTKPLNKIIIISHLLTKILWNSLVWDPWRRSIHGSQRCTSKKGPPYWVCGCNGFRHSPIGKRTEGSFYRGAIDCNYRWESWRMPPAYFCVFIFSWSSFFYILTEARLGAQTKIIF